MCQASYPLTVQYRLHRLNRQLKEYSAGISHCARHLGIPKLFPAHRMLHAHCWLNLHLCIDDTTSLNFASNLKVITQPLHSTAADWDSINYPSITIAG